MSFPDYLSDQMHAATRLPSVFSAEQQSEVAVTDGENTTQAAGNESGNTTPLEPEVQEEEFVRKRVKVEEL